MRKYLDILEDILENGESSPDRTGTGVKSIFGVQTKYNLQEGFPLLTTKKMSLRLIFIELIWIIRGDTNIKYLVDRNCNIWNEWPFQNYLEKNNLTDKFPKYSEVWKEEMKVFIDKIRSSEADSDFVTKWGELGPVYGKQWRNFNSEGVDQLKNAIKMIRENPNSRRIIVSAWNPLEIDDMLLPPCHSFFQFHVNTENKTLDLQLYQRSADLFLGVPFNIASYSLLLILVAEITNLTPRNFVHTLGNAHIYNNHLEQVQEQITRSPYTLPNVKILKEIKTLDDIENLEWNDIEVIGYQSHPRITAPVAV